MMSKYEFVMQREVDDMELLYCMIESVYVVVCANEEHFILGCTNFY